MFLSSLIAYHFLNLLFTQYINSFEDQKKNQQRSTATQEKVDNESHLKTSIHNN